MKKYFSLLLCLLPFFSIAAPGDTTVVQTFTFGSPQDSTFYFPTAGKSYYKILMYYTLKCNPGQTPACGEWDYLTYTYLYQKTGKWDSTINRIDTTWNQDSTQILDIDTSWTVNEVLDRYEIGRFITPYGIGLDLGAGFTWVYDVTDYRPLLQDSVHLSAGNWQELLDLKFLFIEGTPPREAYMVQNVWNGYMPYTSPEKVAEVIPSRKIRIDDNAGQVSIKVRVTGHGFGGNENCAEFCPKNHTLKVNGSEVWNREVWRDNCAYNPVYPQGGTWVYNRANWCPGAEVETYTAELGAAATPGATLNLDYTIDPYTWNGQGSQPYYQLETQLISYHIPDTSRRYDAALEEILSPSDMDMYSRINPVCGSPRVRIRNTGTETLTDVDIFYGVQGQMPCMYHWKGSLGFLEETVVELPACTWVGATQGGIFEATVNRPNGMDDQYALNDRGWSHINVPPVHSSKFIVYFKTNNAPQENSYQIRDFGGQVLYQKSDFSPNTLYRDTVTLPENSCFTFHFMDSDQDGISWWANQDGTGTLWFTNESGIPVKRFNPDFGAEVLYHFTTSYSLGIEAEVPQTKLWVYPNPARNQVLLDRTALGNGTATIQLLSLSGQMIRQQSWTDGGTHFSLDLSTLPPGIYLVQVMQDGRRFVERVVKE